MRFLILGSLEVRDDDGGEVALSGVKLRALLAVLLLHANRPVSTERLVVALWGEDAPGAAAKTLQVHVWRLRKALGDPGMIATTPAGYCLRVGAGDLDAARFERQVACGRRALAGGRAVLAGVLLREALAMWRGPALADLRCEAFARAEVERLEEQRLAALEARVTADLAAGRHEDLVAELRMLQAQHPTREHLAAQLMLALYRCERQTDALAVYRAVRQALVADVGVEPGCELRALHDAILHQDVALDRAVAVPERVAARGLPIRHDDALARVLLAGRAPSRAAEQDARRRRTALATGAVAAASAAGMAVAITAILARPERRHVAPGKLAQR